MFRSLIHLIQEIYGHMDSVALHQPIFSESERRLLMDVLDSTFVSSVGKYVNLLERDIEEYTGCPAATCTVNGTSALHLALIVAGVRSNDLVITQSMSFIATANAITYCGAKPVFLDVDLNTLSLSPTAVEKWLAENAFVDDAGSCRLVKTRQIIRACIPVHTFGHPADLDSLLDISARWNLVLVEDAAEALGSLYKRRHAGTFGQFGVLSFNGNKIITGGGGGMILCSKEAALRAKHLSTVAKVLHPYEYIHDDVGFNYRLPNINAALICGQLEKIESFIEKKRALAHTYAEYFLSKGMQPVCEPKDCRSNYWLNAVICEDFDQRSVLLEETHAAGVATRPVWTLISRMSTYRDCVTDELANSTWLESRVVCLPSSVPQGGTI